MPLLLAIVPLCGVLGFVHMPVAAYYGFLLLMFALIIAKAKSVSIPFLVFVLSLTISCAQSIAPGFFKIWQRFALLVVVLGITTPLISGNWILAKRLLAVKYLLMALTAVSVGSFFAYFLGINYMRSAYVDLSDSEIYVEIVGVFGGLTTQSMILGPIAAISVIYTAYLMLQKGFKNRPARVKWLIGGSLACSAGSVLLSASRGAFVMAVLGCAVVYYLMYRRQAGKFVNRVFQISILAVILFPLYSPFAAGLVQKQENNELKGGTFYSRESKWDNRIAEFKARPLFGYGVGVVDTRHHRDYNSEVGVVEPGSSWLAILSMSGIVGLATFLILLIPTLAKFTKATSDNGLVLLMSVLVSFLPHLLVEGYIFAGGSFLCFMFWLFFGACYSVAKKCVSAGWRIPVQF